VTTSGPSLHPAVRACVFAVGGERLATDVRHTREVVVLAERTPVPRAPAHVLGVANLRGSVVPIVDIGQALGLPVRSASEGERTIVVEDAGIQIAVPADEILGLEFFDDVQPPGEATSGPYAAVAAGRLKRADGSVATLLDVPRLIDTVRVGPSTRSAV
jgi:purine-binding chemotaxis protein CheW